MESVTLSINPEWKTIVDSLVKTYADRAGGAGVIGSDLLPLLMAALGSYSLLGADVKSPDNLAYLAREIGLTFIPQVPAAA